MFVGENFSLNCSECVRFALVLIANRVGFNEIGTPADGIVKCEVGARLRYQGATVRILVMLDFDRNRVMSMGWQKQPAQKP